MKKMFSVLFTMLIILSCFSMCFPSASAASKGQLEVEKVTAKPGDEITVAVNIKNNPGIVSIALQVDYDKSVLTLTDVKNGTVFDMSATTFGNNYNCSPYKMFWEDGLSDNNKKTGTLAFLTFKISDSTKTENTNISVSIDKNSTFNYEMKNVEFQVSQGAVKIEQNNAEKTGFFQSLKHFFMTVIDFFKNLFTK